MKKVMSLTLLVLLIFSSTHFLAAPSFAQVQSDRSVEFIHRISVNEYGFIHVNETIVVTNNASSDISLGSFELLYPKPYFGNIGPIFTKGPVELSVDSFQEENFTKVTISPTDPYRIPIQGNATVNLQLYVTRVIRSLGGSLYAMPAAVQPAINTNATTVDILFTLPPTGQSTGEASLGFERTVTGDKEFWSAVRTEVPAGNYTFRDVQFTVGSESFALTDFVELKRELLVSPDISVVVRESLRIHNYGGQDLKRIGIKYLDSSVNSVVILPSETTPLSGRQTATLSGGKISLESVFKRPLKAEENITLHFEYRLPSWSIQVKDGSFSLAVPLTGPVDGFVRNYSVNVNLPPGFVFTSGNATYSKANASIFENGTLTVNFRPGLGWATGDIIPVASALFIVSLVVLLLSKRGREEEVKEAPKKIGEYIRIYEEKIAASAELLEELRSRGIERVGRQEIDDTKRTLEEIRVKAVSRSSELRPSLLAAKPGLQKLLSEIANVDREYDRAVKDLFNVFDQYYSRRMKKETFDRLLPGYQKRLERLTSNLTESLNTIEREFER